VDLVVAAITLRAGHALEPAELDAALAGLHPDHRPTVIHVVAEIPVTTWFRPATEGLRAAGIPEAGALTWYRGRGDTYRPLTAAARTRLTGPPRATGRAPRKEKPDRPSPPRPQRAG
jgi:putative long chain acyl-CoA synthase